MKKLSFILPVYKVEDYIERCIRSISDKNMSYNEYEIIVINDGSPDNSEEIIRNLQREIPNIVLINQENKGVSAARNRGIENSSGEYIVFIDPDDYVKEDVINRLYYRAKKDNLDILQSGRSLLLSNGEIQHMVGYDDQESKIYDGVTAFYEKDKRFQFFDSSVGYLYKRQLVLENKIRFPVGVVHLEDGVFIRKMFAIALRVGFENCDFYQVYERKGSASRSGIGSSIKAVKGDIISIKSLLGFRQDHILNSRQERFINTSIHKYIVLPLMRAINAKDLGALQRYHNLLSKEGILPVDISNVNKSEYLKYVKTLNKSVWLFTISYSYDLMKRYFKSKIA